MEFGAIETLPLEIFEDVTSYLDLGDEARLYATCRRLHAYGTPLLLTPFERNQRAMLWALRHDDLGLFRRCVSFGASAHVVTVFKTKPPEMVYDDEADKDGNLPVRRPRPRTPKHMSTLAVAVRARARAVFAHLQAEGVGFEGIPPAALRGQLRVLMKALVSPRRLHELPALIEGGFLAQVEAHTDRVVAWPLSRAIVAGASTELAQLFLDAGADLQATHEHSYHGCVAPLAAAMLTSTVDMTRLLVRHGQTRDPPVQQYFRAARRAGPAPARRPLFAAVQRLARDPVDGAAMVADCLAHGCDINETETRVWDRGFNWNWRPHQQLSTPLLEFLDRLPLSPGTPAQLAATVRSLAFLLARGARTPALAADGSGGSRPASSPLIRTVTPSCLELLLDRWQLPSLNDDQVFAMVTMLVEAGCMDGAMGRLMRRYCRGVHNEEPYFEPAWRGWRRLLDLFLARPGVDPSVLLLHLLVDSGTREMSTVEPLLVAAVDYLQARGADINAPVSAKRSSALHMLCSVYQHPMPDTMWWHRSPYQAEVVQHRRDLVHMMMSRGADPLLRFNGRDSMGELTVYLKATDPSATAWVYKIGKTLCEGIVAQRLAQFNGKTYMENKDAMAAVQVS
ncbi:hypothetical protein PWT90_00266 [Aphanocladium album]|nr:hypothetical protein PWT90_00266 [Aphanocladium album]